MSSQIVPLPLLLVPDPLLLSSFERLGYSFLLFACSKEGLLF